MVYLLGIGEVEEVAQLLAIQGYRNPVAMDLSQGMLEEARKKGVYQEVHRMELGKPLNFLTDSFDAVISVGVLTVGHAPASSLGELVRITRPKKNMAGNCTLRH